MYSSFHDVYSANPDPVVPEVARATCIAREELDHIISVWLVFGSLVAEGELLYQELDQPMGRC